MLLDAWWDQKHERLSPTTAREYGRLIERRLRPDLGPEARPALGRRPRRLLPPARARGPLALVDPPAPRRAERRPAPGGEVAVARVEPGSRRHAAPSHAIGDHAANAGAGPDAACRSPTSTPSRSACSSASAAALGARRGEVCGLRWTDLDRCSRHDDDQAGGRRRRRPSPRQGHQDPRRPNGHRRRRHPRPASPAHRAMTDRAAACGVEFTPDAYLLSPEPDGARPLRPERATNVFRAPRETRPACRRPACTTSAISSPRNSLPPATTSAPSPAVSAMRRRRRPSTSTQHSFDLRTRQLPTRLALC